MTDPPAFYDDLDACHDTVWRCLAEGVDRRTSPFHTPSLATVDAYGRPQVRTVVLRGIDRAAGTLRIHCDRRSEKAGEIAATGAAALQAYDAAAKIQIRIDGTAELHTDGWFAESIWTGMAPMSRVGYAVSPAPGTALARGGAYTQPEVGGSPHVGRENFGVVVLRAERLEFLYLHRAGHRRALWLRSEAGWVETWLVP